MTYTLTTPPIAAIPAHSLLVDLSRTIGRGALVPRDVSGVNSQLVTFQSEDRKMQLTRSPRTTGAGVHVNGSVEAESGLVDVRTAESLPD